MLSLFRILRNKRGDVVIIKSNIDMYVQSAFGTCITLSRTCSKSRNYFTLKRDDKIKSPKALLGVEF
jgi:hypothetical protein